MACHVKRLRVLLCSEEQQQVDSFCAWLRRHAPQVKVLAVMSDKVVPVLRVLAGPVYSSGSSSRGEPAALSIKGVAIDAHAAGHPLPLERLAVSYTHWLDPGVCHDTLGPLLGALPHLQHLNLDLCLLPGGVSVEGEQASGPSDDAGVEEDGGLAPAEMEAVTAACVAALSPLQHSTSLTSLVLVGPCCKDVNELSAALHQQLLAGLPAGLRRLTWRLQDRTLVGGWSLNHLPALERFTLQGLRHPIPAGALTSLPKQCQLALYDVPANHDTLLDTKEQLVALGLDQWVLQDVPNVLPQ
jgi:hypothetical protein